MNCRRCGFELDDNWKVCPRCYQAVGEDNTNVNTQPYIDENIQSEMDEYVQPNQNQRYEEKQNVPNYLGEDRICIMIFLICIAVYMCIYEARGIAFIVALVDIVGGYIRYPGNRAIRVLFWLFIFFIGLYVMSIIGTMFLCTSIVTTCGAGTGG